MAVVTAPAPSRVKFLKRLVKRVLPRTLFGRSLLIILAPLVLAQVIASWTFYDRHYETATKRLSQGVAGDVAAVLRVMGTEGDEERRREAFLMARFNLSLQPNLVPGGELPDDLNEPYWSVLHRKLDRALAEAVARPFTIDTTSLEDLVTIYIQLPEGLLEIVVPRKRLFSSTTYIFVMWIVGSSIVLFAVAVLFMRNQLRPIRRLAKAADRFGKGQDVPDFKPEGATEVRLAATAFLQMRGRIKRQIQQRTEMLAGVSHDLRAPLTRMKLQLAMLGETPEVSSLSSDVAEMEGMIEGYLAFARGEGTEDPKPTELGEILREVVGQLKRQDKAIDLHLEEELRLPLRPEAMRRCLANLIGNAVKYASQVSISAGRRKSTVEVTIDDDGPGIPENRRAEVFRPFYRIDVSRSPDVAGTGLGLTIARDVVRGHGGDVILEEAPAGGLRARIWLPV